MVHFFIILISSFLILSSAAFSAEVYIVKTTDRAEGIRLLLEKFELPDLEDKKVVIKPNYNSDDPFPATTHIDTLRLVIKAIKNCTPESITITERSGMGNTDDVLENRGIYALASAEGIAVINLDELDDKEWTRKGTTETHWKNGFLVPNMVLNADYIINLPCLKTHRFGGDFTMALKNNVGTVARWHGKYNYMWELHSSPYQRLMIAEINKDIPCDLVIMDAIKGFKNKGPETGDLIEPELMLLSDDIIANDAVGVAILRMYGTTKKVQEGDIFDLDQINRAAELHLGVRFVEDIELVAVNPEAEPVVEEIRKILR
jgi:uncharacterized protein (DUF362 family)